MPRLTHDPNCTAIMASEKGISSNYFSVFTKFIFLKRLIIPASASTSAK